MTATTASGPGAGANYNFVWTNDPDGLAGPLFFASNSPTNNTASAYSTPATDLIGPGSYDVLVTNFATSCASTGTIILQSNPVPIIVASANGVDQMICAADGSITVVDVLVGGVADPVHGNFDFLWYRDAATAGTEIVPVVSGNDLLDASDAFTAPMIMEAGSYFVKARRLSGLDPGSGCESAPFRVNIQDIHVNPIPQVVPFANSTCTGAFLNGAIKITITESGGPGVGQPYDYENFTDGILAPTNYLTNNGDGLSVGDNDSIPGLAQGTYTFIVRNQITQCFTLASATIDYDPIASKPNIIDVITNLPFDCLGSGGDATVTAITIGGGPSITGSPALDPPNFQYDWYDNSTDAFNPTPPPGNVPNAAPTNQRFANPLAAGTYYVSVRDLLTDCRSTPTEVVIDSVNVVYPNLVIQQTSLQLSCDVTFGTASLSATADGQDDTNVDYFFTWYNNLTAINPAYSNPVVSTDSIGDLLTGDYSVRVLQNSTGCESTALFIIPALDPKFFPKMSLSGDEQSSCLVNNGSIAVRVLAFPVADNGLIYPFTPDFKVDLYFGDDLGTGLDAEPPSSAPDKANIPAVPFAPAPGSFISDTLFVGKYTIRLRDNNTGCILVDTTSVQNDRRRPTPDIEVENPLTNCDTRFNGQLSATADGGNVGDYDFYWWSATNPPPVGDTLSFNDKLIGQDQGTYQVLIVNKASGCDTLASEIIPTIQVFPISPDIDLIQPQTICWEDFFPGEPLARPDGWLQANVDGEVLGYRFDWYVGQFDRNAIVALTPDTTGINNLHLTGNFGADPGVYTLSAVILTTGCYSVLSQVVPDERVIPVGIIETTSSFCPDVGPPGFTGSGSAIVLMSNETNVSLRDVSWFDNLSNGSVGGGTQVFNLPPGFYRAEFLTTQFCYGEAVGEVKTEVRSYNLVSSNADNENDSWVIDCISNYPKNNVKVFNRYGIKVYEADGYNNIDKVFRGIGENGLYSFGNDLPDGTYFYIIDKGDRSRPITGYLELVR